MLSLILRTEFQIIANLKDLDLFEYLTIIRRRRGDYRGIFAETKSR
jgi:hypothetical protein